MGKLVYIIILFGLFKLLLINEGNLIRDNFHGNKERIEEGEKGWLDFEEISTISILAQEENGFELDGHRKEFSEKSIVITLNKIKSICQSIPLAVHDFILFETDVSPPQTELA